MYIKRDPAGRLTLIHPPIVGGVGDGGGEQAFKRNYTGAESGGTQEVIKCISAHSVHSVHGSRVNIYVYRENTFVFGCFTNKMYLDIKHKNRKYSLHVHSPRTHTLRQKGVYNIMSLIPGQRTAFTHVSNTQKHAGTLRRCRRRRRPFMR